MAGKSALPLIALAGGAALLMSRKKKKKKAPVDDGGDYGDFDFDPVVPPSPKPAKKTSKRPSGSPPRGDTYDADYWGDNTLARMTSIRQHFADLGYDTKVGPWPMNKIGPKGTMEVKNEDGSMGKLGGNDDEVSMAVMQFQNDYNAVSRCKELAGLIGGLAPDGLVGYYTLNGLRAAKEKLGAKTWDDTLKTCATKGFTP